MVDQTPDNAQLAAERQDAADDDWADPARRVDSGTRTCCRGIGGHTGDCDAQTWRDLTDRLTPEQIAELEYCERENIPPKDPPSTPAEQQRGLLRVARAEVASNMAQVANADIAPPPEAIKINLWERWGDGYGRMFSVAHRDLDFTTVDVLGVQHDDGRVERSIFVCEADNLTADAARELATAINQAAYELEQLQ